MWNRFLRVLFQGLKRFLPRLLFPELNRAIYQLQGYSVLKGARICSSVDMQGDIIISIGENTFIGDHTRIIGGIGNIYIGNCCDISDSVTICSGTHLLGDSKRRAGQGSGKDVVIGNGVWIGLGAIILPGVTIGDGAVVAAGSVVNVSVPSNTLVAGNPAVVKRELQS